MASNLLGLMGKPFPTAGISRGSNRIQMISTRGSDSLAILGGDPAFSEPLYIGRPNIGDRERLLERVNDILDRKWLTNNGRYVQEFEQRIAALIGVKHCVAVCNATVGLELAIRAAGMSGEVIVPSFTFIATAHALQWQQITPVFCDIDPRTYTLDPSRVEELITPRTTGLIGVHLWGHPCDTGALAEIADRHGLKLLFDAAHSFACTHQGQLIGRFGDAEVFSFHATKFENAFDGGAVVTNDDRLAAKLRLMKNYGFAGYDEVIYVGTNGKMSEMSAAMGLTSLESLAEFTAINRLNYWQYRDELEDLPGVRLIPYDETEQCNYQYIALEVDGETAPLDRNELLQVLWAENVIARRYFYPGCHRMEPYRSCCPDVGKRLPITERLADRVLLLPTGTSVGRGDVTAICHIIRRAASHGAAIRRSLSQQSDLAAERALGSEVIR
jgi:dTDP-4-amino-4,6-dideoxygalactose transaminase